MTPGRQALVGCLAAALAGASPASAAPPTPISERPTSTPPPAFIGAPATSQPLSLEEAPPPPRHPFMAPNDRSNIHDDAFQTDTADTQGPLGRDMETLSTQEFADCASVTFDSQGRIETICVGVDRPTLKLFDPRTLEELASMPLPPRNPGTGSIFNDFASGGYFYLDHLDRAVVPTTARHLLVIGQTSGPGFAVERDHDLTAVVPDGDKLFAVMPDWSGRLWVVTTQGRVVTIDPNRGELRVRALEEEIANSFAVDETGGVYIVTAAALYRFDAGAQGEPEVTWREVYRNSGISKPGQVNAGSGTTPTLMGRSYVAITDNADPMNVVVYRRAARVSGPRTVCTHPVFDKGASATDNSLIGTARSLVVENNYGYTGPTATVGGSTEPGVQRVDLSPDHPGGCRTVWRSQERSPTVVPKLSLHNGLVYVYTKDPDPNRDDPFYLTALDFRTGRTVYKRLAGRGLGFNNNYAPISLGPDGTAYVGTLGGLVLLRDRVAPARVTRPSLGFSPTPLTPRPNPRLALGLRGLRYPPGARPPRARPCARLSFNTAIAGPDRTLVRRTDYFFDTRTRPVVRTRSPLSPLRVVRRGLRFHRYYRIRALTTLADGRQASLVRYFRAC